MSVRYVVFEVSLQDSMLQMEQRVIAEALTHGKLMSWIAIDANSQMQTMTVLGVFSAA